MEKLVTFLYILMRDEVTPGTVAGIIQDHVLDLPTTYTNKHLEAYAREIAEKLT